jgi:hypothetical protein
LFSLLLFFFLFRLGPQVGPVDCAFRRWALIWRRRLSSMVSLLFWVRQEGYHLAFFFGGSLFAFLYILLLLRGQRLGIVSLMTTTTLPPTEGVLVCRYRDRIYPPRKIHRIGEDVSFFILIYFERMRCRFGSAMLLSLLPCSVNFDRLRVVQIHGKNTKTKKGPTPLPCG